MRRFFRLLSDLTHNLRIELSAALGRDPYGVRRPSPRSSKKQDGPLIFIVAGEASGDKSGARLMAALREKLQGPVRFAGVGGEAMAAQGLRSLFSYEDLALVGLFEILLEYPRAFRRGLQMIKAAARLRPDLIVFIHVPTFSYHAARRLMPLKVPMVQYVAPQAWIYRHRHKLIVGKRVFDHLISIIPFEPAFFARHGIACTFTGHPVVEEMPTALDHTARNEQRAKFRQAHHIPQDAPLLCLLPGSRKTEIQRLLPIFIKTAKRLQKSFPNLHVVLPTVQWHERRVRKLVAYWDLPVIVVAGSQQRQSALIASDVALAASGTVTTELAVAELPAVIGYRLNFFTWLLSLWITNCPHLSLVNLILGRRAQPEFRQYQCTPHRLAEALEKLLHDPNARIEQIAAYREAAAALGPGGPPPSQRAAEVVASLLKQKF